MYIYFINSLYNNSIYYTILLYIILYYSYLLENYKEAIHLCYKPDIVNIPLVVALLAFAKVCNHEIKEGLEIAKRLQQSKLTDPMTLETIAHTFRKVRAEEQVAKLYEYALEGEPTNNKFLVELFFSYTRVSDHKKMQLTAQKLFKSTNKPLFLFWSVVSMQMQSDLPPAMLAVSEKMMHKMFYETDPTVQPGAEALELFFTILKKQGKLKEAWHYSKELLSRPRGPAITDNEEFEINGAVIGVKPEEFGYFEQ